MEEILKFMNSQIAFNALWREVKPSNGAMIAYVDAVVNYETDLPSINKSVFCSGIILNNSNNFPGGKIDLPTREFNENIYHGGFNVNFQDFSYDGTNFVIEGEASPQKGYGFYKVTLSDIRVHNK